MNHLPGRWPILRVSLFGHMSVAAAGKLLVVSPAAAVPRLLAYLLLHRHEPLPRTHVACALWPDAAEDEALAHLRRQIHSLRRQLPPPAKGRPWIVADGVNVRWNPECEYWLDVEGFENRCSAVLRDPRDQEPQSRIAGLERAVSVYEGDLLSDFYDDWVLVERERLRRMYAEALARLVCLRAAEGDLRGAVTAGESLVTHDNLREDAHRLVIALHYLAGDRGAALAAFDDCRRLLAEELDVQPMPETARLVDAIRDSEAPARILELIRGDLTDEIDPAALATRRVPTNLRSQPTRFIGREPEIAAVTDQLEKHRLVTLTGPGGCGKTRLALEVAAGIVRRGDPAIDTDEELQSTAAPPAFRDGVWWVDLAPVEEATLVPGAVAAALGVREDPDLPLVAQLERAVGRKDLLLVLDNAEHVATACATLAERLLGAGTATHVLATSREPLGVPGELTWLVAPLTVPPEADGHDVDEVMRYEAPRLFLDRARLCDPAFGVDAHDVPCIATLCRHLDGIPLAIELAAAQVQFLSVSEIAERLDDRFRLLVDRRAPLPRHQTLLVAIDWSYEQLNEPEQVLFRRLAVFRGGWTLEAAAVCGDASIDEYYVPALLASLVAKSMVVAGPNRGSRRYRMLETIRHYARDRLAETGEADTVRGRHLTHYLALAEEADPQLTGADQIQWLDRLEAEHANLQAALRWCTRSDGDPEQAERLAVALWRFWMIHNHFTVGRTWLELVARHRRGPATPAQAMAVYAAGSLAALQGDTVTAAPLLEDSLELFCQLGDMEGESWALNDLALVATQQCNLDRAMALYEESLALKREVGHRWDIARSLCNLGELAWRQGDHERASTFYTEGLALSEGIDNGPDSETMAGIVHNLGELARCEGDYERSYELYRQALGLSSEIGDRLGMARALAGLGGVAAGQGKPRRAAMLLGAACTVREETGATMDSTNAEEFERMVAAARAQLDEPGWEAAWTVGRALTLEAAVDYALAEDPPG